MALQQTGSKATDHAFEDYGWTWAQENGGKLQRIMDALLPIVEEYCIVVIDNECQRQHLADDLTRVIIGACAGSVRDAQRDAEKKPYEFHGDLGYGKCPLCNAPLWPDANRVPGHFVCTHTGTTVIDPEEVGY